MVVFSFCFGNIFHVEEKREGSITRKHFSNNSKVSVICGDTV